MHPAHHWIPILRLSDLLRNSGAHRIDVRANADGTNNLRYFFAGGKTRDEHTAQCVIKVS